MEFSLNEIIDLLIKRFLFIILCTLIGLSVFYGYTRYYIKPIYTASLKMYVSPSEMTASADLNELNYAQKVVATYISFLQTKTFYSKVINESGLKYLPENLSAMTVIQSVNDTEVFQVSVTTNSPEDSYHLALAMQKVAPELIKSITSSAQISVVDPAVMPERPSGPNIRLNMMVGAVLGFLLAILFTFLWEIINVRVKNQEDLRKKYEIPILGIIPNYGRNRHRADDLLKHIPILKNKRRRKKVSRLLTDENKFVVNEAYNSLRANLRFTIRRDGCRKLIINSPIPEDGKSTTSANIAITIAQTGARVLLLDCDLRKGTLHTYFNVKSSPGISEALSGMANDKDIIQNTQYENLQIITMGAIPPNPTELLGSVQMEELVKRLEKNYDYMIMDSPPVNVVSDALSLIKLADGVLIVVREGVTSHPNIAAAITKYKFSGANILGFVMNGAFLQQRNKSKTQYYYYYSRHKKQ